ncbi:STAS domain-containing protein [Streptomyces sp. MJP52]|uniref:STAS domain-containing protein n=1 Tax=Streptomyces sp. MJP52 TaxID=2940555 RepID=UPI00247378B6|nr:STAS domain-containing protein [Streptomyces sp. MJP52]MDH6229034.1 anti-anti-sigma factor [Streptomyces sp. MJP52]
MTTFPPSLHLTTVTAEDSVRIEITGDLDYDNAGLLLNEVTARLGARPRPGDLRLHCAGVGAIDSTGLSVLLMIGRRTASAGTRLHLDERPAMMDRLLDLTGTLEYFTAMTTAAAPHTAAEGPATT